MNKMQGINRIHCGGPTFLDSLFSPWIKGSRNKYEQNIFNWLQRVLLTTDKNLDGTVRASPKTVAWHTKIRARIIVSGFLNHVYSGKTGSEVDTVTIKLVLAGRWVCVSHTRQCNATVSTDYCIHFICG